MSTETRNIYFKSDFQILLESETGWAVPFRINFYTNSPSRGHIVCFDGEEYHNCHLHEDGRLCVAFDDHGLGLGKLMAEIRFYLNNECYQTGICDEVLQPFAVTVTPVDPETGEPETDPETGELIRVNLQLSLQGASTIETIGTLPAFFQKGDRGDAFEYSDFTPEQIEELKRPATEAALLANEAARNANQKAMLAYDAAGDADTAADNADAAAQAANSAAGDANTAAENANQMAALAEQKARLANDKATLANNKSLIADSAAQRANALSDHPMKISEENYHWLKWDESTEEYVDTGVMATSSPYATFEINLEDGNLESTTTALYGGPTFSLNQVDGNLEITI